MRTILSGLMASAIAATAAFAMTAPAKADRIIYYGEYGRAYRAADDWRWHRWHRHHRPQVRVYSSYNPYYYRSYDRPYYDDPYYPRYYGWRQYHRPGVSVQFGF
jgi:hypothetical protein